MIRGRLLVIAVLACLFFSAGALGLAAENLTVGDFAVMLASRVSPDTAHLTPVTAAEVLRKSGIRIQSDLSSPLTEAGAADLFSQFGVTLQAARPSMQMERSKAEALVGTFGQTLAARSSGNTVATSSGKGTRSTPSSITFDALTPIQECQELPSRKECHTCCGNLGYSKRACGQACSGGPKASAIEPTP